MKLLELEMEDWSGRFDVEVLPRRDGNGRHCWCWCRQDVMDKLRIFFDLPCEVKRLWISLHNRPSKWRIQLRVIPLLLSGRVSNCPALSCGGKIWLSNNRLDLFLRPLIGRTVWLEVKYQ